MSTAELVYRYKLEMDKLDSNDFRDLEIPVILMILNRGIMLYVKEVYSIDNKYRLGLEGNQKRIDDLQVLIKKDEPDLSYIQSTQDSKLYLADFSSLVPETYLHLVRSYSFADKDNCTGRLMKNHLTRHDNLNDTLIDPDNNPSFEWQSLPIVISANKIWAYSDGTFTPKTVHIDYLRYPLKVDIAGFTDINGNPSTNQNSELPDYVLQDIVTISAKYTKLILNDPQGAQLSSELIAN